jgi:hypothetical protein
MNSYVLYLFNLEREIQLKTPHRERRRRGRNSLFLATATGTKSTVKKNKAQTAF